MCEARPAARVASASPLALSSAPSSFRVAASVPARARSDASSDPRTSPPVERTVTRRGGCMSASRVRLHGDDAVTTPLLRRSSVDTAPTELPTARLIARARAVALSRDAATARMPIARPAPASSTAFTSTWARASAASAASSPATSRTAIRRAINWRRVGEIEGGWFPDATPLVSLDGLQPLPRADLPEGCPVDAYTKDPVTGIVRHSADACIGCQVLHLELLVRRAAVQPRARRRRQVRHVPRPARARPGAGLRQRLPGRRDRRSRSSTSPTGAPRSTASAGGDGRADRRRQPLDDADHAAGDLPPNARPRRHHARHARACRTGRWWS